jgi:hypothetical protein
MTISSIFNKQLDEFISDILIIFPEDEDILVAKNSILLAKKANPRIIIKGWFKFVTSKYCSEIMSGDIEFFLNKDYAEDLTNIEGSDKIIEIINRLRMPIRDTTNENKQKSLKYIQNLTQLSLLDSKNN